MGEKQSKGAAPGSGDVAAGTAAEAPPAVLMPGSDGAGAEAANALPMPSESEILAKLVGHLGSCKDQRMPLAEMKAAVPASLQAAAQDTQKIKTWLSSFGGLIQIIGEPGQELIVLDLGGGIKANTETASNAGAPASAPVAAAPAPQTNAAEVEAHGGYAIETGADFGDDDSLSACTVQLRGLPFRAQVNDIKVFLGEYAQYLSTKDQAIRLLLNRDGRPSGFARVQFSTPEAAKAAREAMHKQPMGDRYVEVLACSDRAGKARHRRAVAAEAEASLDNTGAEMVMDSASEAVERERVLQECRDHMRMPGRQQLLLSMLGIALSPQARTYLRRLNLGLKHFLARFPGEFRVEGPKGCEQVIWCPNGMDPYISNNFQVNDPMAEALMTNPAAAVAMMNAWAAASAEMPATQTNLNHLLASPTPQIRTHPHCEATPSDWGTPGAGRTPHQAIADANAHAAANASGTGPSGSTEMDPANPYAAFANFGMTNFGMPPWAGPWPGAWPPQDMGDMDKGGEKGFKGGAAKQRPTGKADVPAARSHAHLHPQSHPFAHKTSAQGATTAVATTGSGAAEADGPNSNVAAVRLRGLPFSMSVQDVLAFFSQYDVSDRIADGPQAAQLLPKANGRPSGQARVQMRTRYDAEVVQQALHNQWIGGRYIEVFVYGDETEQQVNDFNRQLGFPAGTEPEGVGGGDPVQAMPGFPGFPPVAFPGAFAPSPMVAPPWANMGPGGLPGGFPGGLANFPGGPGVFPGGPGGFPGVLPGAPQPVANIGAEGSPQLGTSLDTLFSFLYTDKQQEGEGSEATAQPRNAVQV